MLKKTFKYFLLICAMGLNPVSALDWPEALDVATDKEKTLHYTFLYLFNEETRQCGNVMTCQNGLNSLEVSKAYKDRVHEGLSFAKEAHHTIDFHLSSQTATDIKRKNDDRKRAKKDKRFPNLTPMDRDRTIDFVSHYLSESSRALDTPSDTPFVARNMYPPTQAQTNQVSNIITGVTAANTRYARNKEGVPQSAKANVNGRLFGWDNAGRMIEFSKFKMPGTRLNCGFFSTGTYDGDYPINREVIMGEILANSDDAFERSLLAPEIRNQVLSGCSHISLPRILDTKGVTQTVSTFLKQIENLALSGLVDIRLSTLFVQHLNEKIAEEDELSSDKTERLNILNDTLEPLYQDYLRNEFNLDAFLDKMTGSGLKHSLTALGLEELLAEIETSYQKVVEAKKDHEGSIDLLNAYCKNKDVYEAYINQYYLRSSSCLWLTEEGATGMIDLLMHYVKPAARLRVWMDNTHQRNALNLVHEYHMSEHTFNSMTPEKQAGLRPVRDIYLNDMHFERLVEVAIEPKEPTEAELDGADRTLVLAAYKEAYERFDYFTEECNKAVATYRNNLWPHRVTTTTNKKRVRKKRPR